MSGLGNFSLNTLGNMSTLGSLAQSAQRLDRLMAGNRSRQEDNYGRNNSRRSMDDDFFGGRSSDRGRRRSPSPPRRFNRDDRRNDDRRDRRRNREDSIYGSSSGAGILGAAPSGNDRSSMNSGLGDLGGSSWNDNNPRGGLNLDTQTQQLLNMMQTQQLLAAVQAQAKLANQANQQPPSLMGTNTGYSRQGGRMMNQRGGRFGRNDPPRQGYNRRDDRKRRRSPPARPFKRDRKDDNTARKDNRKTSTGDKDEAKKDAKQEGKETKAKSLDKGAEGKDKKQESVESETKITKNAAGEDVEELVKNNYDGKRYWCSLCKIVCMKSKNIYKHFVTERHVKAAIEKQGKVFDPEIMKQQEAKKEEPKKERNKDISEFLKYVCTTKQTAKKVNNDIYISSLTDCTVKITDFTTEQDFMGSEFVKAVSGFKCQLCKSFLRHGHQIIEHLRGKRHTANYEKYLKENPEYLKSQRDVNKNLVDMLKKDEGKDVVLQENNGEGLRADDGDHKSDRKDEESDFMDEYDLNENSTLDDDSKMADESSFNDSAINDSIQDYSLVESEKEAEKNEEELESEDKTETKEIEEANEVEKVEVENKEAEKKEVEVEKEVSEGVPEEKEKELPMEADELEEEFPLLEPPANQMKEDEPVEPKVEEKPEVEAKVPEVDTKAKEPETPETPIEPVVEPEETEDVTPSRRGRKGKRGRGSAKAATRGRRRTPRAAKNVKKTEEVIEPGEIVDTPVEAEKDPEKEAEPEVPVAEVPKADVEEPASSQEIEEMALSQETAGDVEGIDGFEVIDEVEGESEGESEDEA